jgi:hypothetical protein
MFIFGDIGHFCSIKFLFYKIRDFFLRGSVRPFPACLQQVAAVRLLGNLIIISPLSSLEHLKNFLENQSSDLFLHIISVP